MKKVTDKLPPIGAQGNKVTPKRKELVHPVPNHEWAYFDYGLTKREWFMGMALVGLAPLLANAGPDYGIEKAGYYADAALKWLEENK